MRPEWPYVLVRGARSGFRSAPLEPGRLILSPSPGLNAVVADEEAKPAMEMPRHAQPKPATEATRREPLSVLGSAAPLSVDTRARTEVKARLDDEPLSVRAPPQTTYSSQVEAREPSTRSS
jgi:hypothetical protein